MQLLNKYEKQILEFLILNDKTLSEISKKIGISKPATSKYLKKLEEQKLIKGMYEKNYVGRAIRYSLQQFHLIFSIDPKSIVMNLSKPLFFISSRYFFASSRNSFCLIYPRYG